jgi:hypothetical protein
MRARAAGLILAALCASGCRPGNTYVLLTIERGTAVGDIDLIVLDFTLSGRRATRQLTEAGGAPIALPTTASIQILDGEGALTIVGTALRADVEVSRGTVTGAIEPGTTPLTLRFGEDIGPGADLGGPTDFSGPPHTLSVTKNVVDNASGTVTSTSTPVQPGIDCGPTCTQTFANNSTVILKANPAAGYYFGGWTGDCSGFGTCMLSMSADHTATATFSPANIVFTTSTAYSLTQLAALGSGATMTDKVLSGADKACSNAAMAGARPGRYVAWLSATGQTAAARLKAANPTGQQPRGWVRIDGRPSLDALSMSLSPYYPIFFDETGMPRSQSVWTATAPDGSAVGDNCRNWTSTAAADFSGGGNSEAGAHVWTAGLGLGCDTTDGIYCFGVDYVVAIPPPAPPVPSKLAFVAGSFDPATGLSGADALCNARATAAGRSGTFHALLATSSQSAASRIPTSGVPYVRSDGVVVALHDADLLLALPKMEAPLDRAADASPYGDVAASGAANPTMPAGMNCSNWTTNAASQMTMVGSPFFMGSSFFMGYSLPCNSSLGIYCLQD